MVEAAGGWVWQEAELSVLGVVLVEGMAGVKVVEKSEVAGVPGAHLLVVSEALEDVVEETAVAQAAGPTEVVPELAQEAEMQAMEVPEVVKCTPQRKAEMRTTRQPGSAP